MREGESIWRVTWRRFRRGRLALIALIYVALMTLTILGMIFGYRDNFKGTDRGSLMSMAVGSVGIIGRSARFTPSRWRTPGVPCCKASWRR